MSKRKRIDVYAASASFSDEIIKITEEDFKELERSGNCKIDPRKRSSIIKELERYMIEAGIEENSSSFCTPSAQFGQMVMYC